MSDTVQGKTSVHEKQRTWSSGVILLLGGIMLLAVGLESSGVCSFDRATCKWLFTAVFDFRYWPAWYGVLFWGVAVGVFMSTLFSTVKSREWLRRAMNSSRSKKLQVGLLRIRWKDRLSKWGWRFLHKRTKRLHAERIVTYINRLTLLFLAGAFTLVWCVNYFSTDLYWKHLHPMLSYLFIDNYYMQLEESLTHGRVAWQLFWIPGLLIVFFAMLIIVARRAKVRAAR